MKQYIQKNFLLMAMAILCTFSSCNKGPCKGVKCGDNGYCYDGACSCDEGYEGESCETLMRDKFIGSYTLEETCSSIGTNSYVVNVTVGSANNLSINFDNLHNEGITTTGTITTGRNIYINAQSWGNGNMSGSGYMDELTGIVYIEYNITPGSYCEAVLTKM